MLSHLPNRLTKGTMMDYSFNEQDAQKAFAEWGCNCGPTSLAFALQIGLDRVRGVIPGFEERRYTSPTMMKAALANLSANVAPTSRTSRHAGPICSLRALPLFGSSGRDRGQSLGPIRNGRTVKRTGLQRGVLRPKRQEYSIATAASGHLRRGSLKSYP